MSSYTIKSIQISTRFIYTQSRADTPWIESLFLEVFKCANVCECDVAVAMAEPSE